MDAVGLLGRLMSLVVAAQGGPACAELVELDATRTAALVASAPEALSAVYASEAAAGPDREVLAAYAARGLRLRGAQLDLLSCVRIGFGPDGTVLRVVDRLGPSSVVDRAGAVRALPRDGASEREVVLVETSLGWRIAASR